MDKTLKQDIIVMSFLYVIGGIQSLFFSNPGVIKSGILLILLAQSYYNKYEPNNTEEKFSIYNL